jgi:CrcB protein
VSGMFLVGFGGFVGAVLRYVVSGWVEKWSSGVHFPYGTLAVNLVGCLMIGLLSQLADSRGVFTSETRLFVFIGMLGAFTTFSTFGNETLNLLRAGKSLFVLGNMTVHLVGGLGMVWLGGVLAQLIWR